MTILVTGATGNVGRHLVRGLDRRGCRVRALTRHPDSARLPAGVEVVPGTHIEPHALADALAGVTHLHITVIPGLAETGPDLVRRAVEAGVRRMTIVWGGENGPTEEAVAASGVEWTRLEPQEFMSNTLAWTQSIRAENVVREPYDYPSALVHEADIAAVAVTALLEDGHAGRVYQLTGPAVLTVSQRVAALSHLLDRDIRFEKIPPVQALDRLIAEGNTAADAQWLLDWYASPNQDATTVVDTVTTITGRPARTFAQWVTEHAHRF